MKVIFVEPNKQPVVKTIKDNLQAMQELVGGYIQPVYFPDNVALVCNEEGKVNGLPFNRFLCNIYGEPIDIIQGNFFLCYAPPEAEEFMDLTDEMIRKYINMFAI